MDVQGFIEFNSRYSPDNSGKASSYATAIRIIEKQLSFQDEIDLHGKSLYDINDIATLDEVLRKVKAEVKKMRNNEANMFDSIDSKQRSYPLGNFCSAALNSLKKYALYELEVIDADKIVAHESNPRKISQKLITHFDIGKVGEDVISQTNQRKGQDYFRHMVLSNYNCCCALTGINVPQLLLASHIIPWADKAHKEDRLNPENGICLSALYDKAFDKGLITFSPDDYSVVLSSALREYETQDYYDKHFRCIDGVKIKMPKIYTPNKDFLAYHRDKVFMGL